MGNWLNRIKAAFSWGRFVWFLVSLLGLTGTVTSVGGSIWAMIIGVPTPIAIMAGYCTFVAACYLALAPLAYRALKHSPSQMTNASAKPQPPNYNAWRLLSRYSLHEAAHLWCDIDPNAISTYDTAAWFNVLSERIKDGTLELESAWPRGSEMDKQQRSRPDARMKITRSSLQTFARDTKSDPKFLRD